MNQEEIELLFSKKHAHDHIMDQMLAEPDLLMKIGECIDLVSAWVAIPAKYDSKQERKDSLSQMDIQEVVQEILCTVIKIGEATLVNLAGQLGSSLGFADTRQGITLAGELLGILCQSDLFDIYQKFPRSQYYVKSRLTLDEDSQAVIDRCMYMPPMIEKPQKLKTNRSSGYITLQGESLILGGAVNHHNGNICLDVLNTMNSVPLSINTQFIAEVQEEPSSDLFEVENAERYSPAEVQEIIRLNLQNWNSHLVLAKALYELLVNRDNKFYMTHKVDKRGRIYAQGHHVNPMGSSYKKAMVELAKKQKVKVPKDFFKEA